MTVGLFGTFGFKEAGLWDAYKKGCPNITIKEDVVEQSADPTARLQASVALGVLHDHEVVDQLRAILKASADAQGWEQTAVKKVKRS